jgi:PKD repeat protein
MIFNCTEEILRNADGVCYAMNITVNAYKQHVPLKTIQVQITSDGDTTEDVEVPDWDAGDLIGSKTQQILIPTNKQTNTLPTLPRTPDSDYDSLIIEWRIMYESDTEILKIKNDLIETETTTFKDTLAQLETSRN